MSKKSIILTRSKKKESHENLGLETVSQNLIDINPKKLYIDMLNSGIRQHTGHCMLHYRFHGERGCTIGSQEWSYDQIDKYAKSDCTYSNVEYSKYEKYFFSS